MGKIFSCCLVGVLAGILAWATPVLAAGQSKWEDLPGVGAASAVPDVFYSFGKNVASCSGTLDCVNLPKQAGKAALNGVERVVMTTLAPFGVPYSGRDLGENGVLAQVPFLPDIVGWAAFGYGMGAVISAGHWSAQALDMSKFISLPLIFGTGGVGLDAASGFFSR